MTNKADEMYRRLLRFCRESCGGVMVYTGLMLPVLLGFAGLSVDVGVWYANKRVVQAVADAAALGGALEVKRNGDTSTLTSTATEYASFTEGRSWSAR